MDNRFWQELHVHCVPEPPVSVQFSVFSEDFYFSIEQSSLKGSKHFIYFGGTFVFILFFFCHTACRTLVSQLEHESAPLALDSQSQPLGHQGSWGALVLICVCTYAHYLQSRLEKTGLFTLFILFLIIKFTCLSGKQIKNSYYSIIQR